MKFFMQKAILGSPFMLLLLALALVPPACGCAPRGYQGHLAGRHAQYPMPPIWSTEEHVVFNADRRIYVVASDGVNLSILPHARGELGLEHAISVSSGGLVGFTRYSCRGILGDRIYTVQTVSIDGANNKRFAEDHYAAYDPVLSPDGSRIAFRSYDDNAAPEHRSDGLFLVRSDEKRATRVAPLVGLDHHPIVWSPNGQMIVFFGNEWAKLIVRPDGSIDGNSIPKPVGFLYVIDIESSEAIRLFKSESLPAWSPDGERIAFIRREQEVESIATVYPDGSGLTDIATIPQIATAYSTLDDPRLEDPRGRWLSWSPDGSKILIQRSPFLVVDADGSGMKVMDAGPGAYATWSPDGSRIAALLPDDLNGVKLFTMNPDGSDLRALVRWDDISNNRWTAAKAEPLPDGFGEFEWTEVPQ